MHSHQLLQKSHLIHSFIIYPINFPLKPFPSRTPTVALILPDLNKSITNLLFAYYSLLKQSPETNSQYCFLEYVYTYM